ncbi:MAG: hypothetical protein NTX22_17645 [Ignavibacteriales bacterium]|nr:hypothetical protein [Ignavibacteriales bacterium]
MTIIVPKKMIKEINDEIVSVELQANSIEEIKHTTNWGNIEKAKGILKKTDIDPIDYQVKSRNEWEKRY